MDNELKYAYMVKELNEKCGTNFLYEKYLGSGQDVFCFLVRNENGATFVLKIPKVNSRLEYFYADYSEKICDKARSIGSVFVPQSKTYGDNGYIVEEYAGSEIDFDSLDEDEREYFAETMADFFAKLHKTETKRVAEDSYYERKNLTSLRRGMFKYKKALPLRVLLEIEKAQKYLKSCDNNDEILTTIHGDFRSDNVLFREDVGGISLIDWELAGYKNIYCEFVPNAPASQNIPFDILYSIIKKYNQKSDLKIDPEKVRCLMLLGMLNEYMYVAGINKKSFQDFKTLYDEIISVKLEELESAFKGDEEVKTNQ